MKLNRSIAAGVTALAVIGGATACKSSTPVSHTHSVVVVHPAPVLGHTHTTTTTRTQTQTHPVTGKKTTITKRTTTHH